MKAFKPISVLFFLVLISVIPVCIYLDHLHWIQVTSTADPNYPPKNEGLQFFIPFGFAAYSSPFLVWLGFIFFSTNKGNIKRRIWELVAVFALAVIPALLIEWIFYSPIK